MEIFTSTETIVTLKFYFEGWGGGILKEGWGVTNPKILGVEGNYNPQIRDLH